MKVKVLSKNLMVDFKKIEKDSIIDLADPVAKRFLTAGLVEAITETKKTKE